MLIIRPEQMKVLREPVRRRFEERMLSHLRSNFADEVSDLNDDDLRALVSLGVSKADAYEIVNSREVSRFIEQMVRYGADFDHDPRFPRISEILQTQTISGDEKMARVEKCERTLVGDQTLIARAAAGSSGASRVS